jgi:hypothetical protein
MRPVLSTLKDLRRLNIEVEYPFGPDAQGYIVYAADGYMSVAIMRAGRRPFAVPDLLLGTLEEQAQAAATYVSYAGRYELEEGKVIHYVEISLFPNWIGTRQERFCEFAGDRLTLSTPPLLAGGRKQRHYLVWERVGGAPPA